MEKKGVFELTNPQKSIWNTELFFSDTTVNNICVSGTIYEDVNIDILKKAVNETVRQNDAFRTRIIMKNDIPMQYISDYKEFDIDVVTVSDEQSVKLVEQEEVKYKFEIIDSDLYKFKLVKFGNNAAVVLNAHHIIADSWSLGLTIQEILRNYHSLIGSSDFEETTSSYIDYINSENEYKESQKFQKDKEYWEDVFSTIPEQATIPSLKDNARDISNKAKRLDFNLNKMKVIEINQCCRRNNVSIFNFFMAIYSLYIGRVSNLDDFVIGTPILNRTNFKDKHTLGMFVNTVPVRVNIDNNSDFKEFTHSQSTTMMNILRHQKYSYTKVLEDLRERNLNIPNLYNIIISYQITKAFDEQYGNYSTNWSFNDYCANDLNIHILDINDTGDLIINYDYLIDKYSEEDIKDFHNRILNVIDQILLNNDITLNNIEIITKEEKDKILNVFNNTNVNYPKDKTIVDLFEEQVNKTPNNIAVVFEDQKLTYKELNEKANSLANYLITLGIKPNTVIGVRLNKRLEMIIGILAIIKCGCCYLPMNMQYPQDRVSFMLKDSNCKWLLGTEDSLNIDINANKVDISLSKSEVYRNDNQNLNTIISPENLIYIIYTSGSTGMPKGAMLCHRNLVRLFKNDKFLFNFNENDVWTMFHSVAFDFSVWEMYGALLFGGKLVLLNDEIAQDPNLLLDLMRREKVTIFNQTPTYFYKLLKAEIEREDSNLSIRYIVFGGEALKPNLIKDWNLKYPKTQLINMYGITETTVHVTYRKLLKDDLESPSSNIGVPIPTLHVIIVDKNLNLLPFGVEGEMCVVGEGVFKGYLNRDDLNKTKLLNKPEYSDRPIYRSGDTAIMHKDGHLEYIGRIDTQVKIRGFRVELGEIEEKIYNHANVETCIVTKKVDENGREMLCAYYIKNGPINISNLRIVLNKYMPSYMIPQYFIEIDKVPININGKTDFKALPMPSKAQTNSEIVKPRNDTDSVLVEVYKSVLHVENVSISDSFFELGGDSLTAISVCENINQKLNTNLKVKDILDKNIIMDLSDHIAKNIILNEDKLYILPNKNQKFYPLSSAQKRIYYTYKMMGEDSIIYNVPGAILINKILDKNKVENCFRKIIEKQSSFRTTFVLDDNEVKQKVYDSIKFNIATFKDKASDIENIINQFPKPFSLENAPLLRVELHYLDNDKTLMLIDSHHIIMDGSSLEILINDFCKLYNGEDIDKLEIEYKDFSVWENDFIESENIKESEDYWLNKFKDSEIPSINMPYDYNMPSSRSYRGKTVSKVINKKDFDKYLNYAKELGVSPYMFFVSAFFILLYKYTGQEEILLGSPVAGRENYQLKNIIGMFVNNIVVDAKIESNDKFVDFLGKIKTQILEDLAHQNYPYDLLVKKLKLPTDNSKNPLFDIMFAYQNTGNSKLVLDDQEAEILNFRPNISKFNLSLEIDPNTRIVNLEYCTDLFKGETIEKLYEHYINTLNYIIENRDVLIKNICIISEKEKNKLLYQFNNTLYNYDETKCIHNLFEEQVKRTPNNIALIFEGKELTYSELNKKANCIASYLRENEFSSNDIIGIMLPRSLELIIAMLGVLKSGASYIPIDPTYPKQRIDYMIKDSEAKCILTINDLMDIIELKNKVNVKLNNNDIYSLNSNNHKCNISPEDSSYIIYTSGSTGLPKGVNLKHKSLTNLCHYLNNNTEFLNEDCKYKNMISVTTASFDIFIFETLISLQRGLKVILANEEEQRMPSLLDKLIQNNDAQIIQMTPSRMQFFIDNIEEIPNLSKLKYVVLAGEPLPVKLKDELLSLGIKKVYNGYGPSETTVFSTFTDVTKQSYINIGKPLYNTKMYLLDKDYNLAPIGIPGELYISGDGVGKGYLNKQDITNERFIEDLFNKSIKMYKTGDLCKFDDNGELYYIERVDNQVKIRGLRIELEEVENKILEFPFINKAKVIKQKIGNREILSAYYIANRRIRITELRKHLNSVLPRYMVPSYFTALDDFPYTPNGKIDKKALPIPTGILGDSHKYVAPKTDLEIKLVSIWEQILNTKPIGITDNFFELGGDSILAMNLNVQLLKITDKIKYADIFSYPTIKELENKIQSSLDEHVDDTFSELKDKYKNILENNNILPEKLEYVSPKNILITGVTGFLGVHILDEFLKNEAGKAYVLVRKEPGLTAESKLLNKLHYYFGDKYDNEIGNRIIIIQGDVTVLDFGLNQEELFDLANSIDVIVNTAAKVSHYGSYQDFYNINVKSVENLTRICKVFDKKLYHVSTLSVSGNSFVDQYYNEQSFNDAVEFRETDFYIGQSLENVYIKSKFEAERLVLDAILDGVDAYILRVGNLMPRYSDGKFQENYMENAYMNRLQAFLKIQKIPNKLLGGYLEFTPIDYTANAIVKLLQYKNNENRIFHILNHKHVLIKNILNLLEKCNTGIEVVDDATFKKMIKDILHGKNSNILNNLINDFDKDMNLNYDSNIKIISDFTIQYLKLCDFEWPLIRERYIKNIINLLKGE